MKYLKFTVLIIIYLMISLQPVEAQKYQGHGKGSVSEINLKKFAPPKVDSNQLKRIQSILDIRSPSSGIPAEDGKSLYYTWNVTGTTQVWKVPSPGSFPVQMTAGQDVTYLLSITPDSKRLILVRDEAGQEHPGLYWQSTQGGRLNEIFKKENVKMYYEFTSDDSEYIYFTTNEKDEKSLALYKFHLPTKKIETVFDKPGKWYVADYKNTGELLLVKMTGNISREYYLYHQKTKEFKALFGQNEKESYKARFTTNANELIVKTNKFGEFHRLYLWNDGKFKSITPEWQYDISSFSIDRKRQRIVYSVNQQGYTTITALNAKTLKELTLPSFKSASHVYYGSMSRNARYMSISVAYPDRPGNRYIYDWQTNKLTEWTKVSLPEEELVNYPADSLEYYTTRDGVKIPMFVTRPIQCKNKLCPVIVTFHGGPESQSRPRFDARKLLFLEKGYVLVYPNVRGSYGYGKSWLNADNGPKRLDVITDIEDCAIFIKKNWQVLGQSPKLAIKGGSYGGYSTLVGMSLFAGAYDVGVASVGMSSLITFLENTAPYRRSLRIAEYGDPIKDRVALEQLSPITHIQKVKDPLLILHGANDPRVPAGESIQMYEELSTKQVKVDLILYPDEGHGIRKRHNRALNYAYMLKFFDEHLQGK
ncbi:hypothetical protein BVY03_04420 [bacterium K02(2017)]|nr:hypothetical protein BVY03_04420 [bacterium K02(2017)]